MIKFLELLPGILISWIFVYKNGKTLFQEQDKKLNLITIISLIIFIFLTIVLNIVNSEVLQGTIKILCSYCFFCLFYKIVFNKTWSKIVTTAYLKLGK